MRLNLTLLDGRNGRAVDAVVDCDITAPATRLLPALSGLLGEQVHPEFAQRIRMYVDGREVAPDEPAGEAGVRHGAVVALFEPADLIVRGTPGGVAELRVVAGPGSGRIHRLLLGSTTVGFGAAGWSLPDVRLPADALVVQAAPDGDVRVTCAEGVAATLETDEVTETVSWPVGGYLQVGDTVLARVPLGVGEGDVTLRPEEAVVDFNRPPRMMPPDRARTFTLPDKPTEPTNRRIPWIMVVAPMLIAVPMALLLRTWYYLLFGLMSPLMMLANYWGDKKNNRKEYQQQLADYQEQHAKITERIRVGLVQERDERRRALPDPGDLLLQAVGPGPRLWERRVGDHDYLRLRLGLTDLTADLKVEEQKGKNEDPREPDVLHLVPTWLDLAGVGVLGVAGGEEAIPLAQWIVGQVALLHSPLDVQMVLLTDPEGEEEWSWLRWVPHLRDELEASSIAIGTRQESVGRRLAELGAIMDVRASRENRDKARPHPDIVVFLDGARRLRALPAVVDLLRRGPALGVQVICFEEEVRQLPAECQAIVSTELGRVRVHETTVEDTTDVIPDLVEPDWCQLVARRISPLRDTTPQDEAAGLPGSARLLEEIQLDPPTPEKIGGRWTQGRTTDVILGAGYDGPFRLDLRKDGPHALIAGTTGSGKSEFLQTWVSSLAIANRPDELTFVLVDYKGGSAFAACSRLPHTVGMVTDLDTHLVRRALVSLGAELHRREHLLAVPGAKDLEDYWALQASQPDLPSIPRLVLVIDEFASMVAELPDFVTGLVSIAQRGRSLGIHLVLATQRPSGVVSADIRANTNLRISLRVTDTGDSEDVIDAPDAAYIAKSQPGRAYVRSGASTLMPFQSGRVGGRSPDAADTEKPEIEALAWPIGWTELGIPAPPRPKARGVETDEADTDLTAVVDAITQLNASLGLPDQHRPWLDALPENVTLDQLPPAPPAEDGLPPAVGWGIQDLPAEQAQRADTFQLGRSGHLFVIGGPRSGRSTALRTLAGALARSVPVRDLNIYGLDCGNGSLLGLQALPHTGVIATRMQVERARRLIQRVATLIEERQAQLGMAGVADLAELRATLPEDERPPYVLFLLDRWDGFASTLGELDSGALVDQMLGLLREGASVGVHIVVSGDRNLGSGRLATLVENKLALRLAERGDYSMLGIPVKEVPDAMVDGRAVSAEPVIERQVAVLAEDVSGAGQNAAIRRIVEETADRDADTPAALRPFRLEELPTIAPLDDALLARLAEQAAELRAGWVPLAIGGDELAPLGFDLSGAPTAVVGGPPKSGKTGTLRFVAAAARAASVPVLGVCAAENALLGDLGDDGVLASGMSEEDLLERLKQLPRGGLLLVDDGEMLRENEAGEALNAYCEDLRGQGIRLVVAGDTSAMDRGYSGWLYNARKSRQGLLLSPMSMDEADLLSARFARSALLPKVIPGRGYLVTSAGQMTLGQVPRVE